MRRLILAGIAVIAMLTPASPASAITYGLPDGNAHPEVGALLAPQAYPDGTWETCSGTLISPTVFLTAAHCDQGVSRVAVTFDSSYNPATGKTYWVRGAPTRGSEARRATHVVGCPTSLGGSIGSISTSPSCV